VAKGTKRELLEAEHERLTELRAELEKDWKRTRWLALLLPASFALFPLYGPTIALMGVFLVVGLIATALYLIGVRRKEYDGELEMIAADLEAFDG